jgi:hypothetical protein
VIDRPDDVPPPRSPLRLYEKGIWDPAEQYWGEPDGLLEVCLVEVIAAGPRLQFEFEQLLPGGEDPDAGDPILDAIELRDRGYPERARALLEGWPNGTRAASTRTRISEALRSSKTTRRRRKLTTRLAYGSPSPRCPTTSVTCLAGDGSTTAPSSAARTA